MTQQYSRFLDDSARKAFDPEHRRRLEHNIGRYDEAVIRGKKQFRDLELAKRRAANIKHKSINKLDYYLNEFVKQF